jgi:hypothetical protein
MLIGRDGALALPPIPELRSDQRVVEFFNLCWPLSFSLEFMLRP